LEDDCRRSKAGSVVDTRGCAGNADSDGVNDADQGDVANGADACPDTEKGVPVLSTGCGSGQE
jgi:OOP family OmpA-OmpF porin